MVNLGKIIFYSKVIPNSPNVILEIDKSKPVVQKWFEEKYLSEINKKVDLIDLSYFDTLNIEDKLQYLVKEINKIAERIK